MALPSYDLDKIKFATDQATFNKAVDLHESKKVIDFKDTGYAYTATVIGTSPYRVFVSNKHFDEGNCDCYLGQNNTLCKHMVAVAIYAVLRGKPLKTEDKEVVYAPRCSGQLSELSKPELESVKKSISEAVKYIKPYNGPSRIWLSYQDSLSEGCNRLSAIISKLPVSDETANMLVKLLLRLDKKLTSGGVDDSDGTVGGFIEQAVGVLQEFARLKPSCIKTFRLLENKETCFGWEEPLLNLMKNLSSN